MILATLQQDSTGRKKGGQIVIKQPHDITGHEREFLKEARLLHKLNGHKNIVGFLGICTSPIFSIVQEYAVFLFKGFGDEKEVSSLGIAFISPP